ncbi:MAG UNVERIFIED_CONTAM: hypothetical protein LVR29_10430 [Microcystis novacekii LVE1205-3]
MQNIRLGPTLPAFISPNVLKFLVQILSPAADYHPAKDLADCLS